MKRQFWMFLMIFVSAIVLCSLLGCGKNEPKSASVHNHGFTVKKTLVSGNVVQVIELDNGVLVFWNSTNVDLVFGRTNGGGITVIIDPEHTNVFGTMLTVADSNGAPGEFVFDMNADGIPENRRFPENPTPELFYKGAWYPRESKAGDKSAIRVDGKLIFLRHDGTYWRESPSDP